jgi:PadR family transcriptional regulator
MEPESTDVIQGTLDLLILKVLSLAPLHGYGITQRIEQVSRGVFKVNPGSLLTALRRLERAGWLDSDWRETENARRARYYALTRAGHKRLAAEAEDWRRRSLAVGRLLAEQGS